MQKEPHDLERPLECCQCRKPIEVCYTESVGQQINRFGMCKDCPVLMSKLYGQNIKSVQEAPTTLCCGACGITLEEVRMGSQLGCPLCYEIFSDEIVRELALLEKVSPKVAVSRKAGPLHCGKIPGQTQEIDPSLKILELQQVLNETLKREDYEQAARFRDQIRAIEETQRKGRHKRGKRD